MNVNNNTALFVSITIHQKEPLGCIVYSHFPTNDSFNKCIHSCCCCCLPYNYVTNPFSILKTVIKNKKVYIIWTKQKLILFLSEKFVMEFSDLLINFQV